MKYYSARTRHELQGTHTVTPMNLKDIVLLKGKKPTPYDSISMKWSEQAILWRQKADKWLATPGGKGEWGVIGTRHGVAFTG